MNFKLVYILVSSNEDIYLEQTLLSMYSAKYHMPDAHIILLIDDKTAQTLVGPRKNILQYVDELIEVPIDAKYNKKIRSRLLKVSIYDYVTSNFLFIDSDTLICDSLTQLENEKAPISAVFDCHQLLRNHHLKKDFLKVLYKITATPNLDSGYFNSGVLFVNKTNSAQSFFTTWKENYLRHLSITTQDQPTFELTREQYNLQIKELDGTYNCQILTTIRYLRKIKILHYFASNKNNLSKGACLLANSTLFTQIKSTGIISTQLKQIVENPDLALNESVSLFPRFSFFSYPMFRYCVNLYSRKEKNPFLASFLFTMQFLFKIFNKLFAKKNN